MKKRIFVLLAVIVLLLVSVIPSFAYYYDDGDTDIHVGGLWVLPETWAFTDSYELRFTFYSVTDNIDVLSSRYIGIRFDFYNDTIEYIFESYSPNGYVDNYVLVYDNGWVYSGSRQILFVDYSVDYTDPDQIHYVEFFEYLRNNALDLTYYNYELAIEQEGEHQFSAGYQEGYQEGVNASGGFTQEDLDNAANEGYWSGYEVGSDAGYNSGVEVGWQEGYDAAVNEFDSEGIYQTGYDAGYEKGYGSGKRDHETYQMDLPVVFDSIFHGIAGLMIDTLSWEIFGINVLGTMMAILLVSILAWVITKVL